MSKKKESNYYDTDLYSTGEREKGAQTFGEVI